MKKGDYYIGRFRSRATISRSIVSYTPSYLPTYPTLPLANISSQGENLVLISDRGGVGGEYGRRFRPRQAFKGFKHLAAMSSPNVCQVSYF